MLECYNKKLLRIDLAARTHSVETLSDDFIEKWIGGIGFGTRLLTQEMDPNVDPLSGDNKIYLCVGPLTGTSAPLFAQTGIFTKSPLTGGILNTYAGGHVGTAIKSAGYEVVVLEGKASELVYLTITPSGIKIVDCPELKGKGTHETQEAVKKAAAREDLHTMAIGLAGENQIRYACVISETRAFGRGGAGAVFGAKNIKAIGFAGEKDISVISPESFQDAVNAAYDALKEELSHPWSVMGWFGRAGTAEGVATINERDMLATKYHRMTHFERVSEIDGAALLQKFDSRSVACTGCQIHCGLIRSPKDTKWGRVWTRGPEYESIYSLGSLCFNDDADMLVVANDLAEQYGMDTLSMGVNVAFAMECAERGIFQRDILGKDFSLEFGNADATIRLIHMIAQREGIGDLLAEGTRNASQQIGKGTMDFALQVKGMEFAAWMPERMRGIATTFATANRGACHKRAPIGQELMGFLPADEVEGRAEIVAEIQNRVNALFTLIACRFAEMGMPTVVFLNLLKSASGIDLSEEDFVKLGETIWNLERMFNLSAGIDGSQDRLPEICFKRPEFFPEDAKHLTHEDFDYLLKDYYQIRGWAEDGKPTTEKLQELGIVSPAS
jgi:aldehyde:ferredoxin oxidoreductase